MKPPTWVLHPKTYARLKAQMEAEKPDTLNTESAFSVNILVRESDMVPEGEMWEVSDKGDIIKRHSLIKGETN